jgi:hypothetical protein
MTSLQQTAMGGGSATAKTASYVLVAADAGTSVLMNSASATTITVNTALFAAGDTVYIQNINSGVSTITAGTATVTTSASLALAQWEGGNLYFTSTSAAIFIKGAGAAAASGSLTLLSTTSLSGASTTISSIDQTYKNLYLVMYGMTGDSSIGTYNIELNGSSTNNNRIQITSGAVSSNSATAINMGANNVIDKTSTSNGWVLTINNYSSSTTFKPYIGYGVYKNISAANEPQFFTGGFSSATAITSIKFSTYLNLSTGTVLVYGVN